MSLSISFYVVEPGKHSGQWNGSYSYSLHDLYSGKTGSTLRRHLTEEEMRILEPVAWPEKGKEFEKAKDPHQLKLALEHLSSIIELHEEEFRISHMIVAGDNLLMPEFNVEAAASQEPKTLVSSAKWEDEQGITWMVSALHKSVEHRNELHVFIRNGDKEDYWIEAKEHVDVGGKTITIVTSSWFEYLQQELESALEICDQAIEKGTLVLWAI